MVDFTDKFFKSRHTLYVDAMFFNNAKTNYEIAKQALTKIDSANKSLSEIDSYSNYVAYDLGDEIDPEFDESELKKIEENEYILYESYKQFIQSIFTVHIFCASSLEAHINSRAIEMLKGKLYDNFKKISLEGKWLMLPRLLNLKGFDPGKQPFQGFSSLIKIRNAIVHHKSKPEKFSYDKGPKLGEIKGMEINEAKRSLESTKSLITELAKMLNEQTPWWLRKKNGTYINFEV